MDDAIATVSVPPFDGRMGTASAFLRFGGGGRDGR